MRSDKPTVTEKAGDEAFLSRWSRLKQAESQAVEPADQDEPSIEDEQLAQLTDADMPPLESLTEESDYSGFLSPEVTEQLRQQALQKLFRSACFNVCDGLDDYAEDFTSFEKLGDVITADLKFRMQQEAEKLAQSAEEAGAENSRVADEPISETDNALANNEQSISQDDEDESEASV
jgi:hypothetical protein